MKRSSGLLHQFSSTRQVQPRHQCKDETCTSETAHYTSQHNSRALALSRGNARLSKLPQLQATEPDDTRNCPVTETSVLHHSNATRTPSYSASRFGWPRGRAFTSLWRVDRGCEARRSNSSSFKPIRVPEPLGSSGVHHWQWFTVWFQLPYSRNEVQ